MPAGDAASRVTPRTPDARRQRGDQTILRAAEDQSDAFNGIHVTWISAQIVKTIIVESAFMETLEEQLICLDIFT